MLKEHLYVKRKNMSLSRSSDFVAKFCYQFECCVLWWMLCVAQDELCWTLTSLCNAGPCAAPSQYIPSHNSVKNFHVTRNISLKERLWIRVQKTQLDALVILNCTYLCRNGNSGGDYIINCPTGFWSVQIAIGFQCRVLKQWVII